MKDKKLISQLKELRQIKPSQNWVFALKNNILGEEKQGSGLREFLFGMRVIFQYKMALASLGVLIVVIGVLGAAQNSLPGDTLYSLKRATEKAAAVLTNKDQSKLVFEVAGKRLDDLARAIQDKSGKNVNPAIAEYKISASEVAKNLTIAASKNNPITKEMVQEVKKLEDKKQKIESLGVSMGGDDEFNDAVAQLVKQEAEALQSRTLTDAQLKNIDKIWEDYNAGNYSDALEKILFLNCCE